MMRPGALASTLRDLRRDRRMTQRELAEKSGVGGKTICSFECDSTRLRGMKLVQLLRLCDALLITPAELFERAGARRGL